jgi:pyridoxal phosphate enzyme (YggS family)
MTDAELRTRLADRLAEVEARLAAACRRAGRERSTVTLVAVTKTVSDRVAAALLELGVRDLGENRPQELWRKAAAIPAARWHMIGHLQTNKVRRTLAAAVRVHAIDSVRLLDAVEAECAQRGIKDYPALLEVNLSREASKHGFAAEEVPPLGARVRALTGVRVEGLMTMAAYEADPENCHATIAELRGLRDRLQSEWGLPLPHLSMGMSNDFEVAVEEGATFVRLGTVLFEGIHEGEAP